MSVARAYDAIVVGAGIVGAACALALRDEGMAVALVDGATPGTGVTAAGMGHLVALDESSDELALCLMSLRLWDAFMLAHPGVGEPSRCGTLWVAEDERQLAEAQQRAARLCAHRYDAEALDGGQVARLEPALRPGLCGGVRVRGDSVVYPPAVAQFLSEQFARAGGALHLGRRVAGTGQGGVMLDDGERLSAPALVVAAGVQCARLMPELPIFARKGHLAITDRYPGRLSHQIVSMNYGQSAAGDDALAVAANVQPRATGQWLVGSCRQDGCTDSAIEPAVLGAVLRSAIALLPCLADMRIVRAWTGMRPASPDGRPLIGAHPGRAGTWLACGHEGLGVTTAFASARLLADQIIGRASEIDAAPYAPARFAALTEVRDGL
ncbi:FAD-dependent oxidoreductase [Massilia sp. CCM 8733]|uniref:FAD-dependent oxidoreductase n=1 Tax=Massilia mucilaginosa TaxID=2609282 RepID=A0ABX0P3C0_9BURK|nr:FAD-dependent oxidoreductase [Massilia mucilaginosa]NHZ93255.1 FAD-dependent oxidoreductase [Massilia mucilaginosa]